MEIASQGLSLAGFFVSTGCMALCEVLNGVLRGLVPLNGDYKGGRPL